MRLKFLSALYACELHRRLRRAGTQGASIAYDPGFLPYLGMGLGAPAVFRSSLIKFILRKLGMTMGEMPLSGEALAILAADPQYAGSSGKYFHSKYGIFKETRSSAMSYQVPEAHALWSDSEQLVRLQDGERPIALHGRPLSA